MMSNKIDGFSFCLLKFIIKNINLCLEKNGRGGDSYCAARPVLLKIFYLLTVITKIKFLNRFFMIGFETSKVKKIDKIFLKY